MNNIPRSMNSKREDYLDWHEYFMATAFLAAKRSKDPCSQVGACIVNEDNVIVGIGYNGMPKGCGDDEFPWDKMSHNALENKYLYVCHAEVNAILNKNCASIKNCTLYVALFPCNECAKVIIQSGIKEVIYMSDKHAYKVQTVASRGCSTLLVLNTGRPKLSTPQQDTAFLGYLRDNPFATARDAVIGTGVPGFQPTASRRVNESVKKQFIPRQKQIVIDFSEIDWNNMNQLPPTPLKNNIHEEEKQELT
ncbi:hypothetical protein NQ318_005156 [Aromia moschata]|uniref:Probable deoxycytidylate deaminase n=1 Tax=Aromia moschata TaxID=1265417 RepID=A0AAV8Y9W7_9CUCU|nr:hypothetical protein NQ318_005156 [Aromia moschata]